MKTDKHLYQIFALCPQWLFELMDIEPPPEPRMQSVVLKAIERTTDGFVISDDEQEPITIVEFQFQRDPTIYARIVTEMAQAQIEYDMRSARGVIFFRNADDDPQTEPWNRVVDILYLADALAAFEQKNAKHPMVAVFKPVLELDDDILERNAVEYFRQLSSEDLDESSQTKLQEVFVSWLEQRFTEKTKQEIEKMLLGELPDLSETQSGKDLIAIGHKDGRQEGRIESLRKMTIQIATARFESLPDGFVEHINQLEDADRLEQIQLKILSVETPNAVLDE